MISEHSSVEAAVDRLIEAVLERCFPDTKKQTKFRQYLDQRKEKFKVEWIGFKKKRLSIKIKIFRKI